MLLVGTSGFSYLHWRGVFYPEDLNQDRWLEYYAQRFQVVELNVTFYRLPSREQFASWASRTPEGFRFILKGSRQITHFHRLEAVDTQLQRFFTAASGLAEKLSVVLWQLPETAEASPEVLAEFCRAAIRAADEAGAGVSAGSGVASPGSGAREGAHVRHAFEFRHPSWHSEAILDVLAENGAALVQADPSPFSAPVEPTADFAYLRFHHGPVDGVGYADADLSPSVARARAWLDHGVDVFALFNNDTAGWAPRNALRFEELVASA